MKTLLNIFPVSVFVLINLSLSVQATAIEIGKQVFTAHSAPPNLKQLSFTTPEEAVIQLVDALRQNDHVRVRKILGEKAIPEEYSSDKLFNQMSYEKFLLAFDEKNSLDLLNNDRAIIIVGALDWPLPFPLVKSRTQWHFDGVAGAREWKNRRIGSDEIAAIQVSLAYADAQREYVLMDRNSDGLLEYAQKIASTPGKHDGLYWATGENESLSPMGQAFADAHQSLQRRMPANSGHAYHGYYFKILTAQGSSAPGGAFSYLSKDRMIGGFALIAYPEKYAITGVKSFMISHQGIVYSKDLGSRTQTLIPKIITYNPDTSWTKESD
ncbi:DUF2950 domain-containing protein [Undibacterium sp. Ji67W]|uniref:DUF2950 domain-containing protein n=1 Tax=Undibacterium sp. Ji67W TaxID=3413042 RepID=UPI003BF3FDD1